VFSSKSWESEVNFAAESSEITFLHSSTPEDCHIAGTSAPKQLMVGVSWVKSSMLTLSVHYV
jgi:hypothetical protein